MPKPTIVATTTTEITISPQIKRRLLKELKLYAELGAQEKALKQAKKKHAKEIENIQVELEAPSLLVDGFKVTLVAPEKSKLDKKLFVQLGGDLKILEKATKKIPGTSYVRVTAPGEKDEYDDE